MHAVFELGGSYIFFHSYFSTCSHTSLLIIFIIFVAQCGGGVLSFVLPSVLLSSFSNNLLLLFSHFVLVWCLEGGDRILFGFCFLMLFFFVMLVVLYGLNNYFSAGKCSVIIDLSGENDRLISHSTKAFFFFLRLLFFLCL